MADCPCVENPSESGCGMWDNNTSACVCVEMALKGGLPS